MIHIVGDICFSDGYFDIGFGIGTHIKYGGNPFNKLPISADDIWMGNLECVVSRSSNKKGIYKKQFLIDPCYLKGIQHLNIYNVANNHVMEHGKEAFLETLQSVNSWGAQYVGSKENKSLILAHKEYKVGILSFSQHKEDFEKPAQYWYQPEYGEILTEYSKISNCEVRIAYIHWGCEFINYPYFDQQQFAHWLIDLGFNLVVGLHSHVLQGMEIYKNGYIYYSIGNFLFNMPSLSTRYSIVLNVDYKDELLIHYDYVFINKDNVPQLIHSKDVPTQYSLDELNKIIPLQQYNEIYFQQVDKCLRKYRNINYKFMIKSSYRYKHQDIYGLIKDYLLRKISH